jgi:hypothetical protein
MSMPRRSSLLIAAIWLLAMGAAISGASSPPPSHYPQDFSTAATATILLMPVLFFGAVSLWAPAQSAFYHAALARFIDARLGESAFTSFLVRLKPELLFAVAALVQGTLGLWHARISGQSSGAYVLHGFFISGGISFALAYGVMYYRRAIGVYPRSDQSISNVRPLLPLKSALRTYWWTLIGIAIFPTLAVLAEGYRVRFDYLALPFFAVWLLAAWPYYSGRTSFAYCIILATVWVGGGVAAVFAATAIRALAGL